MVIPEHLIEAVNKIQDTILICPPVISQYAALGTLTVGAKYCQEKLIREYQVNESYTSKASFLDRDLLKHESW